MRCFFALAMLFAALPGFAQTKRISGVITDTTGETVISASIVVKGTTIGTVSDFDGNYVLDVPADAKTLEVSFIGMQTKEVPITGSVINVVLAEDNKVLEEVVVTGYGSTKKRDLVTSVASVGAEQLKDIPVTSASEALQGKLAGVQVTTSDGAADAEINIRVRGGTSITQSNEPLYIVDGFPVSSISDIAPSDIQSMDVLKDAAATAIYGAQGANGVIIITTKDSDTDSDKMTFHIDYTGYVGWKRMAKKYDMMSARDFALMQYEYAYLKGKSKDWFSTPFDPYVARNDDGTIKGDDVTPISQVLDYYSNEAKYYDWQRATFGPTWGEGLHSGNDYDPDREGYYEHQGFTSNHSISLSGGNKNANFNLSYSRIDDKGIMYGSDYARNNISFKAKFKPVKDLTIGMTTRFSNTQTVGPGANVSDDSGSSSDSRVRNAVAYTPIKLFAKDSNQDLEDESSFGNMYDPITTIDHNYKWKKDNKWTLSGYISYKFAKHFTIKTELNFETRNRDTQRLYGPTTYLSRRGDGATFSGKPGMNNAQVIDQRDQKLRNTNTLEYKNKWGQHNFDVLIGEEQTWNKGWQETIWGYGFDPNYSSEVVFDHLNDNLARTISNKINATDNMLSFFARANYNYRGRYYLTATFRADCSTRFARGNQWGYFPSVALAWRMSDEQWMQGASDWLSNLKIRFSYGTAGNNNVETGFLYADYTAGTDTYSAGFNSDVYYYIGGEAKTPTASNSKLKWETTHTRNLGIDYGFFNERLSGAIDLYWNTTKDLIIRYALQGRGGYSYQYRNIGSTENKGVEFSVKGVILDKKSPALSYGLSVDANIAFNFNKVIDLGGMETYPVGTGVYTSKYQPDGLEYQLREGSPMGNVYGFKTAGWYTADDFDAYDYKDDRWLKKTIDENGNEVLTTVADPLVSEGVARPGTVKVVKADGTPAESADDIVKIGNTLPLFTGGFNISAYVGGDKWGKVDFTANFTYSYGNDIVNMTGLDLTTIVESTKTRNLLASAAYGKRYSLFSSTGEYLPQSAQYVQDAIEIPGMDPIIISQMVEGDNYQALKNTLAAANAGASIANPVQSQVLLTDKYVEDGSFLRFQNLTIGYSFPKVWMEKAHLTNVRVFFQATNLFCVSPYSGLDPEVNTRAKRNPMLIGVDYSAYPKNRGFNVGVNFQF